MLFTTNISKENRYWDGKGKILHSLNASLQESLSLNPLLSSKNLHTTRGVTPEYNSISHQGMEIRIMNNFLYLNGHNGFNHPHYKTDLA
jgi:hypothetical protein